MTKHDIYLFWTLSFFSALAVVVGKLGMMLFALASDPPEDPTLAAHWRRKRLWLTYSELMALPAFATIAITATIYLKLEPVTSIPIAMALGALGFGFLLDAVKYLAEKKKKELA
ncbi:hypothetical protein MMA231_02487 [Asticcacaulis sp. MM231]|uniref:hypothetical protein n=1 Tax=Asticcacaulis sp. MM231 TaxID=3157666 RepID=UPI0032D58FB5